MRVALFFVSIPLYAFGCDGKKPTYTQLQLPAPGSTESSSTTAAAPKSIDAMGKISSIMTHGGALANEIEAEITSQLASKAATSSTTAAKPSITVEEVAQPVKTRNRRENVIFADNKGGFAASIAAPTREQVQHSQAEKAQRLAERMKRNLASIMVREEAADHAEDNTAKLEKARNKSLS